MALSPLVSLAWVAPYAALPYLADQRPALASAPRSTGRLVSLIVPARNESTNIVPLLESLRQSRYQPLEIIVVDDRSTDDTAALAEAVAAEDDRIRVIRGADPPPGWYGKPWACRQGWQEARGDLLVFTDADTRHGPEVLPHAVGALEADQADLLTLITGQDCVSFWERLVMPQVWLPLGLRFHPRRVNAARRRSDLIANGQFIMMPREAYLAIGTHEAVRNEVAEDLALAQRVYASGGRVRVWWAIDEIRTRMYTGLAGLIEGWSKNIYLGSRASYPDEPVLRTLAPALPLLNLVFWLVPPVSALATGGAAWALWAWGFATGFWMLICHGMRIPVRYGLLYPLGAATTAGIVLRSILRGGRRVEWRSRVYRDPSAV
jgi:chlorobactene glucosyltransferase